MALAAGLTAAVPVGPTHAAPFAPTAPAAPTSGVLGLRLGSRGPAVAQVQQAIIAMGWPLARGADGVFGVSTQRALMAIQRANGLKVTGATNIATARLLGLLGPLGPTQAPIRTAGPTTSAFPALVTPAPAVSPRAGTAVAAALSQQGVPYQAYAMAPGVAFDCSGLTAWAWAQAGVRLPHQSAMQYAALPQIATADARPGDLLFYHSPISHVTMYLGNGVQVQAARPNSVIQVGPVAWGKVVGVGRPG